jgi:molecular chaperone DnaK (HSP70)
LIAERNLLLWDTFEIRGLPPLPLGKAKNSVDLKIDQNGILKIRAVDKQNRKNSMIAGLDTAIQQQDDPSATNFASFMKAEIVRRSPKGDASRNELKKNC